MRSQTAIDNSGATEHRRSRALHRVYVLLYALALSGVAVVVLASASDANGMPSSLGMPWWSIAAGFFVVEATALHIETRRETYSLSLAGFPLLLGLMSLTPIGLVAARLVGSATAMTLVRRQRGIKLIWNCSLLAAETAAAVAIAASVLSEGAPAVAADWLVLLAALVAADLVGLIAVPTVIMILERNRQPALFSRIGRSQLISIVASTFAIVVAGAMLHTTQLVVLGVLPIVGVYYLLRIHGRLGKEHHELQQLHGFAAATGDRDSLDAGLRELTSMLRTRGAALASQQPDGQYVARAHIDDTYIDLTIPAISMQSTLPGVIDLTDGPDADVPSTLMVALGGVHGLGVQLHDLTEDNAYIVVFDRLGVTEHFDRAETRLFESVAATLGTRFAADRLLTRLEHQAAIDSLTGLANRSTLQRELDARLADIPSPGAVAVISLNRFKDLNDSLGHRFGDHLLQAMAKRLVEAAGPYDLVARLGGDEFALVIDRRGWNRDFETGIDAFASALSVPIDLDGIAIEVGVSIGVAGWSDGTHSGAELLRRADIAMYEAKRTRIPWARFMPRFEHATSDRLLLLSELKDGLANDELVIHLQPQVRATDNAIVGAEALVRWEHPELGLVMPSEFMGFVEQSNLAGNLTMCVINAAADAANRLRNFPEVGRISVNLTSRDLLDRGLHDLVKKAVETYDLDPSALAFEVTESSVIVDIDAAIANLAALRALGCRTSVDDFGVGYASLRYLQLLPIDEVKIDRSFIAGATTNPADAAIVRSTTRLMKDLGLEVVAEGVEDLQTLEFVRQIGCDMLQGYLISRPLPVDEFIEFVDSAY